MGGHTEIKIKKLKLNDIEFAVGAGQTIAGSALAGREESPNTIGQGAP